MNGPALLALQLIDTRLDQLAGEKKRLPERAEMARADAELGAWSAEDAVLRTAVADAEATIAEAERQGSVLDAKKARLEAQLRTVSTERQAEALGHEIATITQQHSELDDEELAAMEAVSDAESALLVLGQRHPDVLAAVETARSELAAAVGRIEADEATLIARRADADAALTDEERSQYAALRARFGGMGIVQLDGRRCTGCHLDLSATEADQVHHAAADDVPECPHCGRLIVR